MGIGNPEIGDEALARKVDLFLIDRLTEMMIKESEKIGVKVIEFRQENPLKEIYKFFSSKNVNCSEPEDMTSEELKEIEQIIEEWKETKEEYRILKKLKELTKRRYPTLRDGSFNNIWYSNVDVCNLRLFNPSPGSSCSLWI